MHVLLPWDIKCYFILKEQSCLSVSNVMLSNADVMMTRRLGGVNTVASFVSVKKLSKKLFNGMDKTDP